LTKDQALVDTTRRQTINYSVITTHTHRQRRGKTDRQTDRQTVTDRRIDSEVR